MDDPFAIHEDVRTEDTELMVEDDDNHMAQDVDPRKLERKDMPEEEEEEEEDDDQSSDDEVVVDMGVWLDMEKLQNDFPGFKDKYKLVKRIGEGWSSNCSPSPSARLLTPSCVGTFSTVYKAEDLQYDHYDNSWDIEADANKWASPPVKRQASFDTTRNRRKTRYVAIKKIYVTSSPARILNELELLHDLRQCPSVCPLITAFRATDQVVAILPYFRHSDFRAYFRDMTIPDTAIYLRSMFRALKSVHAHHILHRDIKPTNFLYDPATQHGVLVDFGLAEREGSDCRPCLCHESRTTRQQRQSASAWAKTSTTPQPGYPKSDTRSSRRANRAGTRGFRAPEVLFKCTEQTTAIDIWSVGVILLTILSKRFPFFNSADDVEAMIEIATIFGTKRMKAAGLLHGCVFETNIPTIGSQGFSIEKIILWSTCRTDEKPLTDEEKMAVGFLEKCMELDPSRRITAEEALRHEFLRMDQPPSQELGDDDDMDMLHADYLRY
jgi:cell division control protein 7